MTWPNWLKAAWAEVAFSYVEQPPPEPLQPVSEATLPSPLRVRVVPPTEMTFGEAEGQQMELFVFLIFGMVLVPVAMEHWDAPALLYALLSLTVVRMVPVFLSMAGSGESVPSRLFLGWFGPRGLASIVFAIIVLDDKLPGAEFMALVVTCTVFFSLVLHGVTAYVLANKMAQHERDLQ